MIIIIIAMLCISIPGFHLDRSQLFRVFHTVDKYTYQTIGSSCENCGSTATQPEYVPKASER